VEVGSGFHSKMIDKLASLPTAGILVTAALKRGRERGIYFIGLIFRVVFLVIYFWGIGGNGD